MILACKSCGKERPVYPDAPLTSASEVKRWLDSNSTSCPCGSIVLAVKLHLAAEG